MIFIGMPFLAAGASAMPMLLGHKSQQVLINPPLLLSVSFQVSTLEVGTLQGAAETIRTISSFLGFNIIYM